MKEINMKQEVSKPDNGIMPKFLALQLGLNSIKSCYADLDAEIYLAASKGAIYAGSVKETADMTMAIRETLLKTGWAIVKKDGEDRWCFKIIT